MPLNYIIIFDLVNQKRGMLMCSCVSYQFG